MGIGMEPRSLDPRAPRCQINSLPVFLSKFMTSVELGRRLRSMPGLSDEDILLCSSMLLSLDTVTLFFFEYILGNSERVREEV